jgi:hypothetical protein
MLAPAMVAPAIVIMLASGLLKGTIGFGAPLVSVPALAMLVGPKTAIVLVSIPLFVTNAAILLGRPAQRSVAVRFAPTLIALIPATFVGGTVLVNLNPAVLSVFVGVVTILFALLSLIGLQPKIPPRADRIVGIALGAVAGLLNGSTSIPGPTFAMYLSTLRLDKRAFVYGITLLLVVGNVAQIATYLQLGLYAGGLLVASAALAPAQLIGQQIGAYLQDRIQSDVFQRLVVAAVAVSGANLLIRSLPGL